MNTHVRIHSLVMMLMKAMRMTFMAQQTFISVITINEYIREDSFASDDADEGDEDDLHGAARVGTPRRTRADSP